MFLLDAHCHLDLYEDPAKMVAETELAGVTVIAVTNAPFVFSACQRLTSRAASVHAAIGLHPQLVGEYGEQLADLLPQVGVVRFIGEVGLDYRATDPSTHDLQRNVFMQVVLACAKHPHTVMTVHSRGAAADVVRILDERGSSTAILHWYSGALTDLQHAAENGCYFSVNPVMFASQNGRKLVSRMPPDRVLTESDGPYTKQSGRRLRPADVIMAVEHLARLWLMTKAEAADVIACNWVRAVGDGGS